MTKKSKFYLTVEEASIAAIKLGITSSSKYKIEHKKDPKLPMNPNIKYKAFWTSFGKWKSFLGNEKSFYLTLEDASNATIKLNIKSWKEYIIRYKEDPRLPAKPNLIYSEQWIGFDNYFGRFYNNIDEASKAAINLGITTYREYQERYKEDPKLTSTPEIQYSEKWELFGNWYGFLGNNIKDFYPTIEEASKAAKFLNINTSYDFRIRYKEDPRLPSTPDRVYSDKWDSFGGWSRFLTK
jgi:hypothetical protein